MKKIFIVTFFLFLVSLPVFSEKKSKSEQKLTMNEKVYGLSKLWSETRYNFVYWDQLPIDYDSLYNDALSKILDSNDDYTYYRELQRFIVNMNDGHTDISLPGELSDTHSHLIPLRTKLVENRVFVRDVRNDTLNQKGISKGTEILKINNVDVHTYAEKELYPFIASSTDQWRKMIAFNSHLTRGFIDEPVTITFKDPGGRIFDETISRHMTEKYDPLTAYRGGIFDSFTTHPKFIATVDYLDDKLKDYFYFEKLDNDIAYLYISSFMGGEDLRKQFDSIYEQLKSSAGLIIDIRGNVGGNTTAGIYILQHLAQEAFLGSSWSIPMYIPPFYSMSKEAASWRENKASVIQPIEGKEIYSKPVAVLIDEGTFSAAEDFCVAFRNMKRGKMIGTTTGGSTGNPLQITLPGDAQAIICTKKDTYPDGSVFVGIGITPDIEVQETVESFLQEKDLVLEKAVQLLQ